jgi:hypothetical protein
MKTKIIGSQSDIQNEVLIREVDRPQFLRKKWHRAPVPVGRSIVTPKKAG